MRDRADGAVRGIGAAGGDTTFTVRVTAAGQGAFACKVNIINNDPTENPYDFDFVGTVP